MESHHSEFPTPVDESAPPFHALTFLIVDDNPDGRFLVSKTLLRKFPRSAIIECQDADAAFRLLASQPISLIVSHRTHELDGVALVKEFRSRSATVPILMMSGIDRRDSAFPAGANAFLTYEEWLMVGNHVASLLAQQHSARANLPPFESPQR